MSAGGGSPEDVRDIFRAIRRGNLAEVKRFLDEGGNVETVGGRFHSTLLTEACRFRATKVIDLLLERGAAANVSGGGFWTPLHYACNGPGRGGAAAAAAAKLVTTLVEHHGEVDATDFYGRTPLHLACSKGSAAVALALLEAGAEPNVGDDDGRTPVHHAASNGRRDVIAVLLGFGGDVSVVDRELDTPLHRATRERQSLAMSLLESAGAAPGAKNCWGELAGTLAPDYKMNPVVHDDEEHQDADAGPCMACSATKGRHYYFCRSEILRELPDSMILGPDGKPRVETA
ncbi:unnamed protein product [Ectocarpus fasciculatus]